MKKFILFALALVLVLSISACNSENSSSDGNTNTSSTITSEIKNPSTTSENPSSSTEPSSPQPESTPISSEPPYSPSETNDNPLSSSQSVNYEIGQVSVLSNSTVYEPYTHFLHSAEIVDNEILAADGLNLSLEDIFSTLPQILYSDDFQVTVDGKDAVVSTYSLYNDKFESVYSGQEDFSFPNETGVYLLCVDVTWGNGERGTQYSEYTGNRYVFKVSV